MNHLFIHSSALPRALLDQAARLLAPGQGGADHPLSPRWVIQPGRLWERRLRRRLADDGIAAGLTFGSLRLTLERAFRLACPEYSLLDEESLYGQLLNTLMLHHEHLDQLGLPTDSAPARWLERNRDDPSLACVKLARQLAGILDDHATHRPREVLRWLDGESPGTGDEAWIAALARHVWSDPNQPRPLALQLNKLVGALQRNNTLGHYSPSLVVAVLTGAQPQLYLQALGALAAICPVHLLVMETCERGLSDQMTTWRTVRYRWKQTGAQGDLKRFIEREQWLLPLSLQSFWGASGITLQQELVDVEETLSGLGVSVEESALEAPYDPPSSALEELQRDIRKARWARPAEDRVVVAAEDRSVILLDATSPLRELEGARDAIREALQQDPTLQPSDILVVLTDTARYAPLLPAVFGATRSGARATGPDGLPRIPWHLADRSLRTDSDAMAALLRLMEACADRITLPVLADLIAQPAIQARLDLSPEEGIALIDALKEAGFRWGLNRHERAVAHQPGSDDGCWTLDFALRRLAAGFVHADGQIDPVGGSDGVTPLPLFEGLASASLAGFVQWAEHLEEARAAFHQARPLASVHPRDTWNQWILTHIPRLMQTGGERERQAVWITRVTCALADHSAWLDSEPAFSAAAFSHLFAEAAAMVEVDLPLGQGLGGMMVASPRMARALPAEMVVVVGLSDGMWPRADAARPRGLLASYRPGDRMRRDDDRLITLEWVLSAGRALVWTWQGRDMHTGESIPPSVVVGELLDVVRKTFAGSPAWTRTLPMHAFAADLFKTPPSSFDRIALPAAQQLLHRRAHAKTSPTRRAALPLSLDAPDLVSWRDFAVGGSGARDWTEGEWSALGRALIGFWESPARAFLRAAGIPFPEQFENLPDREDLAFGPLDRWKARDLFLRGWMNEAPVDAELLTRRMARAGRLPPNGAPWVQTCRDEAMAILEKARACGNLARIALLSDPTETPTGHLVLVAPGALSGKLLLRARIRQLIASVMAGAPAAATLVASGGKTENLPDGFDAETELRGLSASMLLGQCFPLPFFAAASETFIRKDLDAAREVYWEGEWGGSSPECRNPANWMAFRDADPFDVILPMPPEDHSDWDRLVAASGLDAPADRLFGPLAEQGFGFRRAMIKPRGKGAA